LLREGGEQGGKGIKGIKKGTPFRVRFESNNCLKHIKQLFNTVDNL
jgi:hypothetical protein